MTTVQTALPTLPANGLNPAPASAANAGEAAARRTKTNVRIREIMVSIL